MNEVTNVTSNKTPIEIALQMNDERMVSARNLYDFLELSSENFSRWCERNLINNMALVKDVDFKPFLPSEENPLGGRPSQDYLLTIEVAENLAMETHTERGREVRDYFRKTERALVQAVIKFMPTVQQLQNRVEELGKFVEDRTDQLDGRIACLESGTSVSGGRLSDWVKQTSADIFELARYCDCTVKEMYSRVISRMEDIYGVMFQKYFDEYVAIHPNEKPVWRIIVIEYYDLKDAFEETYIKIGREVGLYQAPEYENCDY